MRETLTFIVFLAIIVSQYGGDAVKFGKRNQQRIESRNNFHISLGNPNRQVSSRSFQQVRLVRSSQRSNLQQPLYESRSIVGTVLNGRTLPKFMRKNGFGGVKGGGNHAGGPATTLVLFLPININTTNDNIVNNLPGTGTTTDGGIRRRHKKRPRPQIQQIIIPFNPTIPDDDEEDNLDTGIEDNKVEDNKEEGDKVEQVVDVTSFEVPEPSIEVDENIGQYQQIAAPSESPVEASVNEANTSNNANELELIGIPNAAEVPLAVDYSNAGQSTEVSIDQPAEPSVAPPAVQTIPVAMMPVYQQRGEGPQTQLQLVALTVPNSADLMSLSKETQKPHKSPSRKQKRPARVPRPNRKLLTLLANNFKGFQFF